MLACVDMFLCLRVNVRTCLLIDGAKEGTDDRAFIYKSCLDATEMKCIKMYWTNIIF